MAQSMAYANSAGLNRGDAITRIDRSSCEQSEPAWVNFTWVLGRWPVVLYLLGQLALFTVIFCPPIKSPGGAMAGKIFISYRRDDSRYQAQRIYEAFLR